MVAVPLYLSKLGRSELESTSLESMVMGSQIFSHPVDLTRSMIILLWIPLFEVNLIVLF